MFKMPFITKSTMAATALAVTLTFISTTGVLAAPAKAPSPGSSNSPQTWTHETHELRADMAIYDKYKLHPTEFTNSSKPGEFQQYLNRYASALKQADTIVTKGNSSSNLDNNKSPQHRLATFLRLMRGIQAKVRNL